VHDHGEDIDDAPRLTDLDQVSNHSLHQQEGAADVRIEMPIPKLKACIQKRAAVR
jgi:hypothetical protein